MVEAARCRHFGVCGGCSLQDRSYEDQLALKAERLRALLGDRVPALAVRPSPETWYYRNKIELAFTQTFDWNKATRVRTPLGPTLGFKRKGNWAEAFDLKECFLMSPEIPALLDAVRGWAAKHGLEAYDLRRQRGFIRHLLVREAKNTPDRMVVLLTAPGTLPEAELVEAVRAAYPATTVLWGINDKLSDVAQAAAPKVLYGSGGIEEVLRLLGRPLRFRISPFSFFQTNTHATEGLYALLRDWIRERPSREVWDLYGGGGGIAFAVSDLAEKVLSVELVESSIADSRANAALNGITNVEFLRSKVEDFLPGVKPEHLDGVTVLLDPPRSGLHPKVVKALLALRPERVLYVSCNPKLFAQELPLLESAYRLARCEALDLFPHTEHVELVSELLLTH